MPRADEPNPQKGITPEQLCEAEGHSKVPGRSTCTRCGANV